MLEAVSQRFEGSCMMVMKRVGTEVAFLGSGFLVHPEGYLLTAARLVGEGEKLEVVPPRSDNVFPQVTRDEVSPVPVELIARNMERDVALLKLKPDIEIQMPESILGSAEHDPRGALLMSLGVPFGYYRVHGVIATQSVLSGRLQTSTGTNVIIFDRRVQYGDIGGPLVSVSSSQVIGIVGGVFDPIAIEEKEPPESMHPVHSDLSYAISIEYGAELLDEAL